jgi:hypothetical protein
MNLALLKRLAAPVVTGLVAGAITLFLTRPRTQVEADYDVPTEDVADEPVHVATPTPRKTTSKKD